MSQYVLKIDHFLCRSENLVDVETAALTVSDGIRGIVEGAPHILL